MPSASTSGFFKDESKIEKAFSRSNGVDEDGRFYPLFLPKEDTKYYLHVDLAVKHDRCAVAMAHVESWQTQSAIMNVNVGPQPFVVVDLIRYWTPTSDKNVDLEEVRDFYYFSVPTRVRY